MAANGKNLVAMEGGKTELDGSAKGPRARAPPGSIVNDQVIGANIEPDDCRDVTKDVCRHHCREPHCVSKATGTGFAAGEPAPMGLCGYVLMFFSYILVVLTFPISLCFFIKVVQEYERAVIFRLGQLVPGGAKGPGIFFSLPCTDTYRKVDLRTVSFDVPPQEILSKDSVTVAVDAVVYYRVQNATISVTNVENAQRSTRLLAATTLRNVLGTKTLGEILTERENISHQMQTALDDATDAWGVKVERVEVKDVRLPVQLQRAMAAEAEATREARAKVIAAEGEKNASRALKEASEVISESPAALQLRYLQTLNAISAEKNSTIIFPLPVDLLRGILTPAYGPSGAVHMNVGQNPGSQAGTPPGV